LRLRGVHPDDLPEVIRLYRDGWPLDRLAAKFDVAPSTVNNALRKAGVAIRSPGASLVGLKSSTDRTHTEVQICRLRAPLPLRSTP
jgi:hypothetical protein